MLQKLTRCIAVWLLLFAGIIPALAQEGTITGTVTGEDGKPLAGATVTVKQTNRSTRTDERGNFSIATTQGSTLVFSYVGMTAQELPVNGSAVNVRLSATATTMNDLVVIGYGTARKKDVVGSVNVVNAREAGANTATSPAQLLQGKAAGVQVLQNSGTPGSGAQIIIRGTGSFTSVEPLYVIDGIQGDANLFNTLSPQDIDNITVLKDASATAIYGAAAANGVVIVSTKRARSGAPRVTFTSQWGTANRWRQLDLLNAAQYVDLLRDIAAVQNVTVPAKFNTPGVLVDSTNWQDVVFRRALYSENHVNVSGGAERFNYTLSAGLISQEAIVQDFRNRRLNLRIGLEQNIGRFKFGQNVNVRYTRNEGATASLLDAVQMLPYKPIFDPNIEGGYAIASNVEDLSNATNPLQGIGLNQPTSKEYVLYPQVYGEVSLIKGLRFRSQFSAKIGSSASQDFRIPFTGSNFLFFARQATQGFSEYSNYIWENFVNFNRDFGKHSVSGTLGTSYIDPGSFASINATGSNIANNQIRNLGVALSQAVTGAGYGYADVALVSYFGRLIYTFNDRYTLSASMRRDGASNFGPNNRFGNFPGVGFAWKFSEESFLENARFITDGKLRIGWGRTGNNRIPAFLTDARTFGGSPSGTLGYAFGVNEIFTPGITINQIANPNLKWEETDQLDAGLDLALFNNRVNLTVDYYQRKNKDLLVNIPLPLSNGVGGTGYVGSSITTNAATAENRGIEVTLGYNNRTASGFNYGVSVNGAWNRNKIVSLSAPITGFSYFNLPAFVQLDSGAAIGGFYGYRVQQVASTQAEIDALNAAAAAKTGNPTAKYQEGLLPGDFVYRDLNGDGILNDKDQEILGDPNPRFLYGINANASFKNFDFNMVMAGISGVTLYNASRFFTTAADRPHNTTTEMLNRWRQPGDKATLPRAGQSTPNNLRNSDFFLEDGSFLRLRNLTLGYTFPATRLRSLTSNVISGLRVYVAAENLFTITDYKGYDPEISALNGNFILERGIDTGQLPQPRVFIGGIQLSF